MIQGATLDCRHEIPNHGLIMLFLKQKPCLLIYNQSHQLEEVEGDQAECQSYCWIFLRHEILVQAPLDNFPKQNWQIHFLPPT